MTLKIKSAVVVGVLAFITCAHAFPSSLDTENNRKAKQDDDDAPSTRAPIDFGQQVAQIIAGAFSGNIDSIIKGSLGFIEDPTVHVVSHNTWETLKGNPTKTPPWVSTTVREVVPEPERTEPPAPLLQKVPQPPADPVTPVTQTAPIVDAAAPTPSSQSQPAAAAVPDSVYVPEVYYPGSPYYPTKAPVRTTQPTYATLAPLSVIEGTAETEPEPEETSTLRTTTEEDDDVDEAEGSLSAEVGDNSAAGTTEAGNDNRNKASTVTLDNNGVTQAASTDGNDVESVTDDEDDQDQIDYRTKKE